MKYILASKSPRRRELLALMGIDFEIITADIDETIKSGASPFDEVARLSLEKALAVCDRVSADDIIISADTVVVFGDKIMGKPTDKADARDMLKMLSGNTHKVMSGVTVKRGDKIITKTVVTEVTFRKLDDSEIDRYIQTNEPMDKAGAYGIQGAAAVFVSSIQGDYFNIVGLPVCTLHLMLGELNRIYFKQS